MLKAFTVDYDLLAPGRNYAALHAALERLGAKRMMLSKWILSSSNSASEVRSHLAQFMDSNDRLFVAELSGDWAGRNLLVDPNKQTEKPSYIDRSR